MTSGNQLLASAELYIPLADTNQPPIVRVPPASQTAAAGATVSFWVEASSATPLSYQWRFNAAELLGATGTSLTLTNVQLAQAGWYSVVLTNVYGSVTSSPAQLTIIQLSTRYVWQESPGPGPPYTNWSTAAHVIQDAVDVAQTGDSVLVAGGVYATGGRAVYGTMTNRVAIDRAITVESLMGPEVTIIQGYQVPRTTNGNGAIRCAYLTNGASLIGFTLTNGATRALYNEPPPYRGSSGGGIWCESTNAIVSNCVLTGNSARLVGGAYGGTLHNCVLTGNSGRGASRSTLHNCVLTGNSDGGADECTLYNCTLSGNSANLGGGAYRSTLTNCTLAGNSASSVGGGAYPGLGGGASGCTLYNCTLSRNSAQGGGGAAGSTLNNCTLTGNSARSSGGGAYSGTLNNCIVYFNTAPSGPDYYSSTLNYCCTTPSPTNGVGNITADPELASASHLSIFSPCRGAGSPAYAAGTDIDGEAWATPPSIGCDEYHTDTLTGPLSVDITVSYTNVVVGFPVRLTALIEGRTDLSIWDFDDGTLCLDQPYATHAWAAPGDYVVSLWALNDSYSGGVSGRVTVHVLEQPVHYVALASTNPLAPYTSWATAATNIQDAVDVAGPGAELVVSNGWYGTGGRDGNRVNVDRQLTLRSVNGPQYTVIDGGGTLRCVYLTNGASLSGFTLTNGATRTAGDGREQSGGGVWCESTNAVISNCVLAGNSALWGGGAYGGTLFNCVLTGNSTPFSGGGAYGSTLYNCTLTDNSATWESGGGAVSRGTLYNCTLTGNSAGYGGGASESTLTNCTLTGNEGGGAYASTLYNCTLTGNEGGGAYGSKLYNCTLTNNWASDSYYGGYYGGLGGGAFRSTLDNCTLTGNSAGGGGGAYESTLNNCTLMGNSAWGGGGAAGGTLDNCTLSGNLACEGGGAFGSTLYNCTLTGNSAHPDDYGEGGDGGGAYGGTLYNCTLTGNQATGTKSWNGEGGGACYSTLNNCIVYFNTAPNGPNYYSGTLRYCCTTPNPGGVGNITNAPLFVDYAGGNLRLESNSPCINAGNNSSLANQYYDSTADVYFWFTNQFDLDGNARIVSGTVDIGAYEYQGTGSLISYAWLQQFGLPTDGSADYVDSDGDGHNNWQEWCCQTDPTNPLSVLRLLSASPAGTNVTVTWQSVAGVNYFLERSTNLASPLAPLASNLLGQPSTTTYTDTSAASLAPLFYRVGVH